MIPSPARAVSSQRTPSSPGWRLWFGAATAAALLITAADAVLLQQKRAFFTGGFLTEIHARTPSEALAFLITSLLVDGALAGTVAAVLLWASSRLRLTRRARAALIGLGAAAPALLWAFIEYRMLAVLGDTFDLGLMFDLTGGNAWELLAVSSSHLVAPLLLTVGAASGIAAFTWFVNRADRAPRTALRLTRRIVLSAAAGFVIGLLLFAAASTVSPLAEDGLRRKASGQFFLRLAAVLSDFDRDGFGIVGRLVDPAPFDASIFPYALDVPGNGIDENAVGGDLPATTPPYVETPPAQTPWPTRPDVVLVVLESFRADVVGRSVNGRPVTPVMDALARQGISSSRAFSHNGYTIQSRFHLLTGSLAGLLQGSLIDDFKAQGYETAYFSAQDESFGGPDFNVGFDRSDVRYDARQDRGRRYTTFTTAGSLAVSHRVLTERIDEFLRRRDRSRPLFLYVNFHDTHFPYHHDDIQPIVSDVRVSQREIVPANAGRLREMYDNTAANVDRALGVTLDLVTRAEGRAPAVIVTADHGESLFDEGFLGHGYALNDAQTRIPLIVSGLPVRITEPFGQVDLRSAIVNALSREDTTQDAKPRLTFDSTKVVFQYLGNIARPGQIGFAGGGERLVFDFRQRRQTGPGPEARADAENTEPAALHRLIHFWERLVLAAAPPE